MDLINTQRKSRRTERRLPSLIVTLYISQLIIQTQCQTTVRNDSQESTNVDVNLDVKVDNKHCHSCHNSSSNMNDNDNKNNDAKEESLLNNVIETLETFSEKYSLVNSTIDKLEHVVEDVLDKALNKDQYVIFEGIEIKSVEDKKKAVNKNEVEEATGRGLFSKYTYEYRLFQKIKNFIDTHVLSINLPKAAKFMGFRSFGLNKFFIPLLIGGQVLLKSILFAMFLPSILGSFGKILGKGISQLSATSSQASYPPVNGDDQTAYNTDTKDIMGYETNPTGTYTYPQDFSMDPNEVNELGNVDMSRFGVPGQYIPSKNSYYKNQMTTGPNSYKVFQKIPESSMILSNYDPFYSPILSRLDGIFARLGLAPSENSIDGGAQIGGQSLSDVKLEACREQLICFMYASPAKYAPYSNLVSAQLSRQLNELRRPVSDNAEILRFFRYMRAARQGQEGKDCMRSHPECASNAAPAHTMIAAYHDINKLVSARKLNT